LGKALIKKAKKKGRPPSANPMVHTAVVLPRDLIDRLKRDAGTTGRGLSTEIRQRLQLTYDLQGLPDDAETSGLVGSIKMLADNLAGDLGKKWHQHRYALAAFKAGVAELFARYQPEGDERARPDTRLVGEPEDPPEVVGRIHARLIRKANFED
jgi:hypothetical protein